VFVDLSLVGKGGGGGGAGDICNCLGEPPPPPLEVLFRTLLLPNF
jgi:hypothetical protein